MKLEELNESTKFINDEGVIVYLDKDEKQITLSPNEDSRKRGMVKTIKSVDDLEKVLRVYIETDEYIVNVIKAYLGGDAREYIKMQNKAKSSHMKLIRQNEREFDQDLRKAKRKENTDEIERIKNKKHEIETQDAAFRNALAAMQREIMKNDR